MESTWRRSFLCFIFSNSLYFQSSPSDSVSSCYISHFLPDRPRVSDKVHGLRTSKTMDSDAKGNTFFLIMSYDWFSYLSLTMCLYGGHCMISCPRSRAVLRWKFTSAFSLAPSLERSVKLQYILWRYIEYHNIISLDFFILSNCRHDLCAVLN